MDLGLKLGATGALVERLHGILHAAGFGVDPQEKQQAAFGPSTVAALKTLQGEQGLQNHGEVDQNTLKILFELEGNVAPGSRGSAAPPPGLPMGGDEPHGTVHGTLVDDDGEPVVGTRLVLFSQRLRQTTPVTDAITGENGAYRVRYHRPQPLNLLVRAYATDQAVVAESATVFAAPPEVEINLTTSKDGVVRTPSGYSKLKVTLDAQLHGTALHNLKEDKETHELRFVASAAGANFGDVAHLYIAGQLARRYGLNEATSFAIFSQHIPPSLTAAMSELPDAGIDDAFTTQVLVGILSHSRSSLESAITSALKANIVPASYAAIREAELSRLDVLREESMGSTPYVRGKTSLNDLLAAAGIEDAARTAFVKAYAASGGRIGPTWKTLRAGKSLAKAQMDALNTALSAGELLSGNMPLVKDTLQRLSRGEIAGLQQLAMLDQTDWEARIKHLDPQADSIHAIFPDQPPHQKISLFAKVLANRFASRYPTTAFVGGLTKARTSSFTAKSELITVLSANPKLSLKRTNIDRYVLNNKLNLSPTVLSEMKTAQRLYRLSPHYSSVEALNHAGYVSAQSVYFKGRAPFVAEMTPALGSAAMADAAWVRAQAAYGSALAAFGRFHLALNGINFAVMASPVPSADMVRSLPSLQALFGSLDYCECSDCRSVYSPGAYLVDLLQFLKQRAASGGFATALAVLLARRPDLQNLALGCNNTEITLPYIDLVNELLEAAIAPPATPVTLIGTTGTSAERRALPQQVTQDAYTKTAGVVFPLSLPFDLPFAQTEAFLTALGTSLQSCMTLSGSGSLAARGCAQLGLNPAMQAVVNGTDAHQPWQRWGFSSPNPPSVIDPKTRLPFTPVDWVAALSKVSVLQNRSGLTLAQIYQLLEVNWVTGGVVKLNPGLTTINGVQVVSCDIDAMTFTGLDAAVLDRANRFLRLLTATKLEMWELDWALSQAAGALVDDAFLVFLAGAMTLRGQWGLPLQEVLGFWGPLQTRDVINHYGDTDTAQPSTYSNVFRNPTLLASWGTVFTDSSSLSGTPIVLATSPAPSPAQLSNLNALKAALGLSADDIAAILGATGAANTLSLDTLNVLFRYARVASSLSLKMPDLLLWIELTGGKPFGGTPADSLDFQRRLALLRSTGIALYDLDYLLRNGSASQSTLAFTPARAASVLQTIRDAVAKLSSAGAVDPVLIKTIAINALSTATAVTANVVEPVLSATGVLPLSSATIALLLAQTSGVDPALFPALVAAFTRVAKAAALYTLLQPGETAFAFLVQNAASFNWIDPGNLPLSTPATSPYLPFERLVQALQLNRRQAARSPKLFDVLAAWVIALPADVDTAVSGNGGILARSLNASVPDVACLATSLGATKPGLTAATQPGSLADMAVLSAVAAALDALTRYGISAPTLVELSAAPPTAGSATTAMGVFQAQYTQSAWFAAVQTESDRLRELRRDALVAYVIGQDTTVPIGTPLLSSDDIFNYFLIDPEMASCGISTRLLEASLAVQQFVQQCFLNLVPQVSVDATTDAGWKEWSWMKQFRLWQANRQVFLYPENYLLPELRTDKSPFFNDLQNDLKQSNCDSDSAAAAFENYLRKLVEISHLVVAAHYQEMRPDGSRVLHVFAHTRATPWKWYYRTRAEGSFGTGIWGAWEALNLDIRSDHLLPVVWDQRLHLLWPIFTSMAEKPDDQKIPTTTSGGSSSPARKFWAVEFAMSELSAGQWQAKQTIAEKMYFQANTASLTDSASPLSYTFRAFQDPSFNLQLQVYIEQVLVIAVSGTFITSATSFLRASGTLPSPDASLLVTEDEFILPHPDTSQEPSFLLVHQANSQGTQTLGSPSGYGFLGQDLVFGNYASSNPAAAPVNVLSRTTSKGQPSSVELLLAMPAPHITIPPKDAVFDSTDPFFVSDPSRAYFVQPHFYTLSSSPQELDNIAYVPQWNTRFEFAQFYHPFSRTFLRELEIGGTDRLMQRNLQIAPQQVSGQSFNFGSFYQPQPAVAKPYPVEDVDFEVGGAYALYNWEIFYHAPMFVASQLMRNQQFAAAMHWLEYIFDPTDPSPSPVPGHFWRMRKFYEMNANDWLSQQIQTILITLAANAQQGISDPATAAAIQDWLAHPYDPHRVARLRIGAYAKSTVMKFLDNLIAWGDSLFAQFTIENVAQAEQLYIFADLILGPLPDRVRLPDADQPNNPDSTTYAQIELRLDQFSNALVDIENVVGAPSSALETPEAIDQAAALPRILAATGENLFFCIPPNDQLLSYWSTVTDRLYKIRHCLNLQGVAQPLPLYAPPINPLQLIEQAAGGASSFGAPTFTPVYRFAIYFERALELANDVRAYGSLVLSALEKKDAENLAALRANQDVDIQTRMLDLKTQAVIESQDQVTALQGQKVAIQIRRDFYANIAFMNDWETAAIALQTGALIANAVAVVLDLTSGVAHLAPNATFGAAGFGGSPMVTASYGGEQVADSATSWASVARGIAGLLSEGGNIAATIGGYQRRMEDWKLQANIAAAELAQIDSQVVAAKDRLTSAMTEVGIQTRQIANAQMVSDFLTNKYTNAQLYDWMLTQLTSVHTQAYQLAFSLAQQAEAAYQYELGSRDSFIQFGYWDSQYKGLTAGENLLFDLRRMQTQYLADNTREIELVKHVSLALLQPMALVQLLQTGSCNIALNEELFDRDHPGHYFRRLRSAALTIPCVTGPYTGVHATLVLDSATVRVQPPTSPYTPALAASPPASANFVTSNAAATSSIATSHGQNDAGLFDVNLRDERWLPFEGQGAISTWTLVLDPRDNNFDFTTITDVVLHLRYTARSAGGDPEAVRQALKPSGIRQILISVRNTLSNAYYTFFNPADPNASQQVLALNLAANLFPFSNLGAVSVTDISLYLMLAKAPPAGTMIAADFGPSGGAPNPMSIAQVPGNMGGGTPVAALGADAALAGSVPPGSFTLTVSEASVPVPLGVSVNGHLRLNPSAVDDVVLIVSYKVA